MKIINPNNFYQMPITVDSTLITVDSTMTVDTVSVDTGNLYLKIKPKYFVDEVKISFYNELTEETNDEECFTFNIRGWMVIPFVFNEFQEGDSFYVKVTKLDGTHVWADKVYVTMYDDLQNFKLNIPNNNGVIEL